jgi:hypothetical protein
MKLIISISEEEELHKIIKLKTFIDAASIEEIENNEINRAPQEPGSLALGEIINSITLIIKAANKPLTELAKSLRDFVATYRTIITLSLPDGREIKIDKGRNLSGEELVAIINSIKN